MNYILKLKTKIFLIFILFLSIQCQNNISVQDILSVKDSKILAPNGEKITLKGCNVGNWFVLEMWMLDQKLPDQYTFENILKERFGKEKKQELMEVYRENWLKENDFKIIKSFGMNTIRIPFQYTILVDPDKPYELKNDSWYWLDKAVEWAENNDLYVILDLHGSPGMQSSMDHTGRSDYNRLWIDIEYQNQTTWLWKEISKHYMNNSTIAAYDLLNEPWGGTEEELRDIIFRLFKEIRDLGDNHIIIFPGHYSGIDFYVEGIESNFSNYIYTAHFYPGFFGWGAPVPQVHADFLNNGLKAWHEKMKLLNTPLLIGEFNVVSKKAGGGEMMRRYYDLCEKYNWLATMWSYKVLSKQGGIQEMNWGMVTNKNELSDLDIYNDSLNQIKSWFEKLSTMDISIDQDLQYWLTTKESPSSLDGLPPLPPPIKSIEYNDTLPENWSVIDIGNSLKGGQKIINDSWHVYGGGNDIWNNNDQFRFIYKEQENDFTISISMNELLNTHSYAKAGIMVRNNLSDSSAHALINIFPYGNTEFSYRQNEGEQMVAVSGPSLAFPNAKLKLQRNKDKIIGLVNLNGESVIVDSVIIPNLKNKIYVGLATLSHDNNQLTKAVYSNLQIRNNDQ